MLSFDSMKGIVPDGRLLVESYTLSSHLCVRGTAFLVFYLTWQLPQEGLRLHRDPIVYSIPVRAEAWEDRDTWYHAQTSC